MKIKSALKALGHYQAPEWGVSPYPDPALFAAIASFQSAQGLKADGALKPDGETEAALSRALTPRHTHSALRETAQALQAMGRGGDELLAHITVDEARLLHAVTDGATVNSRTGLLEFWHDYEADAAGVGSEGQNSGPDRYGSDRDNDRPQKEPRDSGGNTVNAQGTVQNGLDANSLNSEEASGLGMSANPDQAEAAARTRRASAKEDTVSGVRGFFDKEEAEQDLMDLSIEDVEAENIAIMDRSKNLAEDARRKAQEDRKAWNPVRFYGPPPPPPTPSGGPRRWSNRPNTPPDPGTQESGSPQHPSAPKSRPGDVEAKEMQKMALERFIEDVTEIAKALGLIGANRLNPLVTLPGFEDTLDKANKGYYLEEDDPA